MHILEDDSIQLTILINMRDVMTHDPTTSYKGPFTVCQNRKEHDFSYGGL